MISVIIPVFNGENYLREALESVVKQKTDCEVEIIVIDDCSTDNSKSIAEEFTDCVISNDKRMGAAFSRNRGIDMAKGQYLFFLDADDVLADNILGLLKEELDKENMDMVLGLANDFISPEITDSKKEDFEVREKYTGILPGCVLIKKEAFLRVGYFDDSLKSAETVDWFIKARNSGLKSKQLDIVTVNRRLHLNNTGRINRQSEMKNYAHILRQIMQKQGNGK